MVIKRRPAPSCRNNARLYANAGALLQTPHAQSFLQTQICNHASAGVWFLGGRHNKMWLGEVSSVRFIGAVLFLDRKSTRLKSSHRPISDSRFCFEKKTYI